MENEKPVTQQETKCYPNMPAFASSESYGLTKREYFAAIAMNQFINCNWSAERIAGAAVTQADELIKALNQ